MNAQARILMCAPDFYGIEYEINPWMNTERQTDHAIAVSQWNALRQILMENGAAIELLTPVAGLPDLVFTANAALIYRDRAIVFSLSAPAATGRGATRCGLALGTRFPCRNVTGRPFF